MCKERGETLASPRKPVAVTQLQERVSRLGRGGGESRDGGLGGRSWGWAGLGHITPRGGAEASASEEL